MAVLFAEGNIDQNQKWVPAYQRRTVETYLRLTQAELARHPGEKPLIVWPETALPFNFDNNGILSALVRNLARQAQSPLLTGVPGPYDAQATCRSSTVPCSARSLGQHGGPL